MSVLWSDPEWDKASVTGRKEYWWVYTNRGNARFIKCYTPALAKLVAKRTGWKIIKIGN